MVVNGGVIIIFFVVMNFVWVFKKRNLFIFWGFKGVWKYIRIFEWKWKRDGILVFLEMVRFLV